MYGPIEMTRNGAAVSRDRHHKKDFWARVDEEDDGLSEACGCYLFILRNRVWYIGMAEKQPFKKEIFQNHKLLLYSEALQTVPGAAQFVFLAKVTPANRFARPSKKHGHKDIRFLEKMIIGSALRRNQNLRNVKDTKLLKNMHVPGLLNKKKGEGRALSVQAFKAAIGV